MNRMSLSHQGLDAKLTDTSVTVAVSASAPLIGLANALDWTRIAQRALADLKRTAKGCWQRGRPLALRVHLAVMIVQALLKETDRGMEKRIQDTPLLQVFCGRSVLHNWHCPDHTKIEAFRNRLSAETHRAIGEYVLQVAHGVGFADVSWMDVDSTVQEANISYPADSTLMRKLCEKAHRVLTFLKEKKAYVPKRLQIDMQRIRQASHRYFFLPKTAALEARHTVFARYHRLVKRELRPVIQFYEALSERKRRALPWYIRRALEQVRGLGWRYLLDVEHFVRTHTVRPGKRLAFHAAAVACIKKGKVGKPHEFGRVFQLGRIGGNFLLAFPCTDVRMLDKPALLPAIHEHRTLFGEGQLKQVGADKAYYSASNIQSLEALAINADGVQRPRTIKQQPPPEVMETLRRRRAGIEPLIQHAKSFGLGRTRMKSDETALASGYRAVMGFNLHQLIEHMQSVQGLKLSAQRASRPKQCTNTRRAAHHRPWRGSVHAWNFATATN
jgi:IS5 family transposase